MSDLRSRFRQADRIAAPDLWQDVVSREPRGPMRPSPWPRVAVAAAAFAVAALGLVLLVRAFLPRMEPGEEPTPTPTGAFRPQSKANGMIAFVRTDPESTLQEGDIPLSHLYTIEPDGSGTRRLAGEQGFLFRTTSAWSPDGSRMALPWAGEIRLMNADGSGLEPLTRCELRGCHDSNPVWSPDGTRLAFSRSVNDDSVWLIDADGTDERPLGQGFLAISGLAWSPDGRLIAVLGFRGSPEGGPDALHLLEAETGEVAQTIPPPPGLEFAGTISWSPDGTLLAFDAYGEGGTLDEAGIYLMRADGTAVRPLSVCPTAFPVGCTDLNPAWSPDGSQIAFTRALPEPGTDGFMGDIFVIDFEGGQARRVTGGPGLDCCPAWQPVPTEG